MCHQLANSGLLLIFVLTVGTATTVSAQDEWPTINAASQSVLQQSGVVQGYQEVGAPHGAPPVPQHVPSFQQPRVIQPGHGNPGFQHATSGCQQCDGQCGGQCGGRGAGQVKYFNGVDEGSRRFLGEEPSWKNTRMIPWEAFAYGEYVGPHRTPHVPQYRVRPADQLEFVFQLTREQSFQAYRLEVGDRIQISSATDPDLNQGEGQQDDGILILSDGSISLRLVGRVMAARKTIQELQDELNERYTEFFAEGTDPSIVVSGVSTDTRLQDLINAVDARFGNGGQSRLATVSPDGTIQLPMIGSVPAIGLSLDELGREINMRYRSQIQGLAVTAVLVERAPTFVYVLGEVDEPGEFEFTGPTSAMQAIALAGGWNPGGNLRQIVVFRRDQNWKLMAVRLDLSGGLHGQQPLPSDEIWLRDQDIVLVPKQPIQRIVDAIDLYFTQGLYSIFPAEFGVFDGQAEFN